MNIKSLEQCPYCNSEITKRYVPLYAEIGESQLIARKYCSNCNKEWYEVWELKGIKYEL